MTYLIRKIAEETSRRERLAKLRELVEDTRTSSMFRFDQKQGMALVADDDALLDFAARVHEIMEVY